MSEHEDKAFRELAKLEGEAWDEHDALLRAARAGAGMMEIAEMAMPDTYFQSDRRVCEMREALKKVEHLL